MKIVIAPNAFKDCLDAGRVAAAMAAGVLRAAPTAERVLQPVADGGDGLVEVLAQALDGSIHTRLVRGPRGDRVAARYCLVPASGTAIIEMAAASGLALLPPPRRDPTRTSTWGTGELVRAALDAGARRIVLGIGGSATCDGATGMAAALGAVFRDAAGRELEPTGGNLGSIATVDLSNLLPAAREAEFEVICDVDNPLLGEQGASRVYSPQKGATPEQVKTLEAGLANLAEVMERDLGKDVRALPGGGAAGGMGAGLYAMFQTRLRRGVEVVLELVGLADKLDGADLVLTGEGRLDGQTVFGKAPAGVAAVARDMGVPCFAVAGSLEKDAGGLHAAGINAFFSICPGPLTLEQAMARAEDLLAAAAEQAVRAFLAGKDAGSRKRGA